MFAFPRAARAPLAALTALLVFVPATAREKSPPAPAPIATPTPAPVPLPKADNSPWLFKGSDIRPNPAWTFGTLPNGLRYAVRRNGVPPDQVAIRIRIDAGSLYEKDSEQGFAHLIEHLSFRASEYVPDGEAKRVWQTMGATFGSDSNAQTTPTQTVYRLDLPSATSANVDRSLRILAGMMDKPVLDEATLNAERPVVLSEQRETPGPAMRVMDAQLRLIFAGQPMADRSPIGTIKTLEAATPASVKAFHERWYRPERTVIAIAGDMEPAELERLVIKNFAGWTEPGPPTRDPDFGKPDPRALTAAVAVEPTQSLSVSYAVLRPWKFNDDTILFNQNRMVDTMATLVMSRRLEQRARSGGSFLAAQVSLNDVARSVNVTSVNVIPIGTDWQGALRDARAVIGELERRPPTVAEVAQAVSDYDTSLRTRAETAAVEMGTAQAEDIVEAVDIRETVASPEDSYKIFTDARNAGFFTPARVFASARKIFQGDATRAFLVTKTAETNQVAQLDGALKAAIARTAARRMDGPVPTFAQLPVPATPGKEVSRVPIAGLNMTEVGFANGVKLIVVPHNGETNRVYVRVRFGRGLQGMPADRETPAWAASAALVAGGVGTIDQEGLDRMTAARRIGLNFGIGDDAFEFSSTTAPADLADQLRLMAAKLYRPRWDPNPVLRARAAMETGYDGFDASPGAVIQNRLDEELHAGDPRWRTPSLQAIRALTPAAFRAFWAPLLASGPIEVQVSGDVNVDAAAAAVAGSIGALPPRPDATAPPPPVRFPAHNATPLVLRHKGNDTQAAAVVAWPTGSGIADIAEGRRLDVLAAVFNDRLFEKLRQGSGVSYSPSVSSRWPARLNGGGALIATAQVPPDRTDYFIRFARETAADLVKTPISSEEIMRILGPIEQRLNRNATSSQFWMRLSEGGSRDATVYRSVRSLAADYGSATPAALQEAARKYLRPDADWTMVVLPKEAAKPAGAAGR